MTSATHIRKLIPQVKEATEYKLEIGVVVEDLKGSD